METVVSSAELNNTALALGLPSSSRPLATILEAAEDMPGAAHAAQSVTEALSMAISVMANLLNPQKILLGGALAQVSDDFFSGLVEHTRQRMFPMVREAIRLEKTVLGPTPGMYGGITVALDRFFYS